MDLTISLLNQFCENILQGQDSVALKQHASAGVVEAIKNTIKGTDFWHIRAKKDEKGEVLYFLWNKKAWLQQEERIEEARRERKVYDTIIEARKEAYIRLCKKIAFSLDVPSDQWNYKPIIKMADKILAKKHQVAQELFELDLSDVPDLPGNTPYKYVNLDEGYAITL